MTEARKYSRPLIATESIELDQPTQDVDHSRVAATGIALSGAAGIETEAPTRNVAQALQDERFMHDILEVTFAEPADENEPQFVEAGVNGEKICVLRGSTARLKRCHVAVIAAAKQERLKQVKVTAPDGSMGYQEQMVLKPVYPFQVLHDPAGAKGVTWLRQIMQRS